LFYAFRLRLFGCPYTTHFTRLLNPALDT